MKMYYLALIVLLSSCQLSTLDYSCDYISSEITESCVPDEMLVLNSGGGLVVAAIRTANRVTYTHVERRCHSACIMIASAGIDRTACHDARYGFHQASKATGTKLMVEFYYRDSRINAEMIESIIRATPFENAFYIDAYTAKYIGIVDTIVDCE